MPARGYLALHQSGTKFRSATGPQDLASAMAGGASTTRWLEWAVLRACSAHPPRRVPSVRVPAKYATLSAARV